MRFSWSKQEMFDRRNAQRMVEDNPILHKRERQLLDKIEALMKENQQLRKQLGIDK